MGLLRWLFRLLTGSSETFGETPETPNAPAASLTSPGKRVWRRTRLAGVFNWGLRSAEKPRPSAERASTPPYEFARRDMCGQYVDLSGDLDRDRLRSRGLPMFGTPQELADWLGVSVGKLAWLTARFVPGERNTVARSHYVYHWKQKRSGGARLIESPKKQLRETQNYILREILDHIAPHPNAHGFVGGRSIRTNAVPHCSKAVVVKWDLTDFYASVRFNRVVAIFHSLGYSREAAIWLASLTTTAAPPDLPIFDSMRDARPYGFRHLPQGAPTSPAIANLSAFSLDVRLAGLAKAFGGTYTRYADDLTISGDESFARRLRNLIPLVEQVIRSERFHVHPDKRKVLRSGQRQTVAGVVVNERPNVSREDYDRLKAILHNAAQYGAATQNREQHPDFEAYLRGRISHVSMLNPARGERLLQIFELIRFDR